MPKYKVTFKFDVDVVGKNKKDAEEKATEKVYNHHVTLKVKSVEGVKDARSNCAQD